MAQGHVNPIESDLRPPLVLLIRNCLKTGRRAGSGAERLAAEGMAGLAAKLPDELGLSPGERAFLRRQAQATFVANSRLWKLLGELDQAFAAARLQAVLLKGAASLAGPCRQAFSLRPMSDIDLLAALGDLPRAGRILRRLGLADEGGRGRVFVGPAGAVDLHGELVGTQRIRWRGAAFSLPVERVWAESQPVVGLLACRSPAPEHFFLHTSLHALKHSYSRLIWLWDLVLAWKNCRPPRLLDLARAWNLSRPLLYSLLLMRDMAGLGQLEPWIERLGRLGATEELMLASISRRRCPQAGAVLTAHCLPDLPSRFGYWRELAFPRRRVLQSMYPDLPYGAALALRAVELGRRAAQRILPIRVPR